MSLTAPASVHESCTSLPSLAIDRRRKRLQKCVAADFLYLMDCCRVVWPVKTAENISQITGASLRACNYWLEFKFQPRGMRAHRLISAVKLQLQERMEVLEQIGASLE